MIDITELAILCNSAQARIPAALLANTENFQIMAKRMAQQAQAMQPSLFLLEAATQNLTIAESVVKGMTSLAGTMSLSPLQVATSELASAIQSTFSSCAFFEAEWYKDIQEAKTIYKDSEFKKFPFLCAEYFTIGKMRTLRKEWISGNKDAVINHVLKSLKSTAIHESIIQNITEDSILVKRRTLLREALWAHGQGRYALSIPLLFAIIEGTLVDKYGHLCSETICPLCKAKRRVTASPVLEKLKSELKRMKQKPILIDQYFTQVDYLLDNFSSNRNPILHGSKIDYPNETLSASLLMVATSLDFEDMKLGKLN
jgi:hypothetical protein